jgi:hypothetical protein
LGGLQIPMKAGAQNVAALVVKENALQRKEETL